MEYTDKATTVRDDLEFDSDPRYKTMNQQEVATQEEIQIAENLFLFRNRILGEHGNVYEGELRSSIYDSRHCVIKFSALSEQNIKEAEILTKLGSHANVISLIHAGLYCDEFEDRTYIAIDRCHKENLKQYLANRKSAGKHFDLDQALDFAKQIILGVTYIHDNNVIHLDLKPSNILLSKNLKLIKIADFGLSVAISCRQSKFLYKRQFGTNGYRPIESFGNGVISQRTDIFSLGTVLYHLFTNGGEIFGIDMHIFVHNVKNDIKNTSGLLVSNPKSFEHLIKAMVRKERCKRPTIWEVSDHPCWRGEDTEGIDDYFAEDDEVLERHELILPEPCEKSTQTLSNIEKRREFLRKMKMMGFDRKPAVAMFDRTSHHLYAYNPADNKTSKMHEFNEEMRTKHRGFGVASFGEYIYVFTSNRSTYRLEYCDAKATWEKMTDWIGEHGRGPLSATSLNAIYLVGGSVPESTRSVTRFSPSNRQWLELEPKLIATRKSAIVYLDNHLYSFGGYDEDDEPMNYAERMNTMRINTTKWVRLESMRNTRVGASAVAFERNIYVIGGYPGNDMRSLENFNPQTNQWTDLMPMVHGRLHLAAFVIGRNLLAVSGDNNDSWKSVEKYDFEKNEWEVVKRFNNMSILRSVLVRLSF